MTAKPKTGTTREVLKQIEHEIAVRENEMNRKGNLEDNVTTVSGYFAAAGALNWVRTVLIAGSMPAEGGDISDIELVEGRLEGLKILLDIPADEKTMTDAELKYAINEVQIILDCMRITAEGGTGGMQR